MAAESSLSSNTDLTREGYFVLNWNLGEDPDVSEYVLQQSATADFQQVISRSIPATGSITITGQENGVWYFRAGTVDGEWSPSVSVEVRHHGLTRAFGFFGLGFVLFVTLIVVILYGNKHTREA